MLASLGTSTMNTTNPSERKHNKSRVVNTSEKDSNYFANTGYTGVYRPCQAWQWMRQTKVTPAAEDWVRYEVADAWQRCLEDYRLGSLSQLPATTAQPAECYGAEEALNAELVGVIGGLEEQVNALFGEADVTVCLTDAESRLLVIRGRDLSACPIGKQLCYPLADWSEPAIGNTGIGTAAVIRAPVAFSGEEHYLSVLHPFTTAGFPFESNTGQLLAILGLIGDRRIEPGILKSLVCILAKQVDDARAKTKGAKTPSSPALSFPRKIMRPAGGATGKSASAAPVADAAKPSSGLLACELAEKAVRLQMRRIPILIVGESGAGKEYLVRKAYQSGPRCNGPFIAVNCASIPRDLIESELFGYASGSFTGARKEGKVGKFLLADKGVLFLDEIGDMGLDLQAVLLRVLENSEFFPVGATQPVKVDVQIFAATNVPIQQAVREGRFRRDLYYRLNGAQLILPPLRERDDKSLIIKQLLEQELKLSGRCEPIQIADEVMDVFLRHPWPGNIRQLSNVIRSALHLSAGGEITIADLTDDFFEELQQSPAILPPEMTEPSCPGDWQAAESPSSLTTLAEWELQGIRSALKACKGNLTHTAKALGITRGTLYKKLDLYGLGSRKSIN